MKTILVCSKSRKMIILFVGLVLLAGVAVMLLWNALIPTIFDVGRITWIQALGLLILARISGGWQGQATASAGAGAGIGASAGNPRQRR